MTVSERVVALGAPQSPPLTPARNPQSELLELTKAAWAQDVIRSCARLCAEVELSFGGVQVRGRCMPPTRQVPSILTLYLSAQEAFADGSCVVRFELYGVTFVAKGHARRLADGVVECECSRLFSFDQRGAVRHELRQRDADLHWSYMDGEELVTGHARVLDLTPFGAAVLPDGDDCQLPNNALPVPARLRIGATNVDCLVRTQRRPKLVGEPFGLVIQPQTSTDSLIRLYLSKRLPKLIPRHSVPPHAVYSLMRDTGYLSLRETSAQLQAWHTARSDVLSHDSVYVADNGRAIGHVSVTRIHESTWLLHQLACLSGQAESGAARLALYAKVASVPLLYDGDNAMVLAYFNQERSWHRLLLNEFVDWVDNPVLATTLAFDRFERETDSESAPLSSGSCVARPATEDEMLFVAALIRGQLPELVADALDIHPGELRRNAATKLLERGREVLVVEEAGQVVAAALCDFGDPNLSLFNLLNTACVYPRTGHVEPSREAQRTLMQRTRNFYAERNVSNPLVLAPANKVPTDLEPGTKLVERMGCVVIRGHAIKQWENYCRFHLGRRWLRHGSSPKPNPELTMTHVIDAYQKRIARSRALVADSAVLRRLLSPNISRDVLLRFLVEYCSLGVQVTQPVEGWIRRAGMRCSDLGLEEIGSSLIDHASHEANHDQMFVQDTHHLVELWNAGSEHKLDAKTLISRPPTPAMQAYIELHEETIDGAEPFGQVAIEYEIERLSTVLLPPLLHQFKVVLGQEVLDALSFLKSHAELDIGHTHLNKRMLEKLMVARPEAVADLARVGAEAMFIYLAFFEECLERAIGACAVEQSQARVSCAP